MERISLDATWDLKTIQAINDLAYLKAKQQYENKLYKELRDGYNI